MDCSLRVVFWSGSTQVFCRYCKMFSPLSVLFFLVNVYLLHWPLGPLAPTWSKPQSPSQLYPITSRGLCCGRWSQKEEKILSSYTRYQRQPAGESVWHPWFTWIPYTDWEPAASFISVVLCKSSGYPLPPSPSTKQIWAILPPHTKPLKVGLCSSLVGALLVPTPLTLLCHLPSDCRHSRHHYLTRLSPLLLLVIQ